MEPWHIGIIAGLVVFVSTTIGQKRGANLGITVLPILHKRGPSTVPELMTEMKLSGLNARGKLMLALGALVQQGKVIEHPVPPGTAMREKINVRKYEARAST